MDAEEPSSPRPVDLPSGDQAPADPRPSPRRAAGQFIRVAIAGLLAMLLIGFLVAGSLSQWSQANQQLAAEVAAQRAQFQVEQDHVDALQAEVKVLKQR